MATTPPPSELAHIPPLPPLPEPPRARPDPRQQGFTGLVARLSDALGDGTLTQATNLATGFPAAAVDLGRLKSALERGLRRLDMTTVRARWDVDVAAWMTRLVFAWVQRAGALQFDLREGGVHVRLETQDDAGYYHYELDVMPGRDASDDAHS